MQTTNRIACQPNASNAAARHPDASGQPSSRCCDNGGRRGRRMEGAVISEALPGKPQDALPIPRRE